MMPVLRLFATIDRLNQEPGEVGQVLRGETRAVETLGESLRWHVHNQSTTAGAELSGVSPDSDNESEQAATTDQTCNRSRGPGDFVILNLGWRKR